MALSKRSDVNIQDTWDLEVLFSSPKEWDSFFEKQHTSLKKIKSFKGSLNSIESIVECFDVVNDIDRQVEKLYAYAMYSHVVDMAESAPQTMQARIMSLYVEFSQMSSFVTPELLEQSDEFLKECLSDDRLQEYSMTLKSVLRSRKHILSESEENLLARASLLWSDSNDIFGKLSDVDMKFSSIQDEKGESVQVTHGTYSRLLDSYNPEVRKSAFESIYNEYKDHSNTCAHILYSQMKKHHFLSDVRGYDSTLEAALYPKGIDTSVYKTLIKTVGENIKSVHDYMYLRKEYLGLEKLNMWDLRVPLVKDLEMKFTYEEAVDLVMNSLKPLGKEYCSILKKGLVEKRWVDKYENKGKRSGAFSGGCYDSYPYILLNFTGTLNDVYTLIHEAGHSMHSYLARENQPYALADYTIFTAEIASTVNERLLTDYLLKTFEGKEKEYVVMYEIDAIRATFFRQTMFAEFELLIHEMVEKGEALTAEGLNSAYTQLNKKYHGSAVEDDSYIQYEWSRIPHFYYNYYVYQYATGIACAFNFSTSILRGDDVKIEEYLNLLRSGGNDYPLVQLKKAGIDMSTSEIYKPLFSRLEELLKMVQKKNS